MNLEGLAYVIVGCVVPCATLAAVLSMLISSRNGHRPAKWLMLKCCISTFLVFVVLLNISHAVCGIYAMLCYLVGIAFFAKCYREKHKFTLDNESDTWHVDNS